MGGCPIAAGSLGSISHGHPDQRELVTCAGQAGLVQDGSGRPTTRRARVQAVLFNALTHFNLNHRSHDKLLIIDGS